MTPDTRRHLHLAVALIAVLAILAGFHLLTGEPLFTTAMIGLLPMSLHRAPTRGRDMPHVPDNRDRLRTYRAIAPAQLGNAYPWRFHGSQSGANPGPTNPAGCQLYERYARDACADGPPALMHYAERRG